MRLSKVLAAGLGLLLLGSVSLAACTSQQGSTAPKASTTAKASTAVSQKEAAKRYFAAMAPVIAQDYRASKQFSAAIAQWEREYQTTGPSSLGAWQDLAGVLSVFVPKAERILDGYQAIQPPAAFRSAHAALLVNNDLGRAAVEEMIHNINTMRSGQQWAGVVETANRGPALNRRVVREFRKAAAKVHVKVPAKLLKVYSD